MVPPNQIQQISASILLLFLIIDLSAVASHSCESEEKLDFCANPQKDKTFDPVWIQKNYPVKSPFLYSNRAFRNHFDQLINGRKVRDDEDYSGLCAETVFDNSASSVGGNYIGFGNLTYSRNCSVSDGTLSCEFTSGQNPNYKESASVYVSYFGTKDENNYQIVVYCLDNGNVAWTLVSIRRKLPVNEIAKALKHIESRGFDMEDVVSPYEDSCEKN